jgi:hypothetical protein
MLKASFTLPNGTLVTIEGAQDDVKDLLDYYNDSYPINSPRSAKNINFIKPPKPIGELVIPETPPDVLTQVVNLIKSCKDAEAIEKYILDKEKSNEANRVLLPLYIVHEYLGNAFGLTTVEISKITTDLGPKVKINRQNALRALARSSASKYVLGDKTRKVGTATKYTLNDRGVEYIKSILQGGKPDK